MATIRESRERQRLLTAGGEQGEQRWAWWGDGLANLSLHGQKEGGQGAGTGGDQGHENRGDGRPLPGALQLLGPLSW